MTTRRWTPAAAGMVAAALLAGAPAAGARGRAELYLRGAGNGHGVGMSQYGAAGYALHGATYQQILRDYYAGTTLGRVDPNRTVTVLLRASGTAIFSGATSIKGWSVHKLDPTFNYTVQRAGARLRVSVGRHLIGTFTAPLQVSGPGPLTLLGLGAFRGAFVFRPSATGNGVMTVDAVGLDDYVRGVVAAEMPPSWPAQALDAQAVAARTYAVTSRPTGADFDVYDSTRSQLYQGVKAETPASDAAVAATSGQVVEYAGTPVVTYFFASSGGETESDQNVFSLAPAAWLVGRPDPYDDSLNNPYHHWKLDLSLPAAQNRLGRLVEGSLIGIKVLQRGISPRIIKAAVVGTKGSVTVTGLQLRKAFGTPSTWMSFTTVSSHGVLTSTTPTTTLPVPTPTGTGTGTTTTSGGGGLIRRVERAAVSSLAEGGLVAEFERTSGFIQRIFAALRIPTRSYVVSGTIFPARRGARLTVQLREGTSWRRLESGRVASGGRYAVRVDGPGEYRVRFQGITGPAVTVG